MGALSIVLEDGVAPADRDVADSEVALVASAHLELSMVSIGHHHVHHPTRVLLKGQRFEPQEVFVLRDFDINEAVAVAVGFENVRVRCLADFALKLFPHVADLVGLLFNRHLLLEPELEALVVDEAHGTVALARVEQRVGPCLLAAPADLALDFNAIFIQLLDDATVDLNGFLCVELVLTVLVALQQAGPIGSCSFAASDPVSLLDGRRAAVNDSSAFQIAIGGLFVSSEVFDAEFESAELDDVASLQSEVVQKRVLLLAILLLVFGRLLRLEVPDDDKHHVCGIVLFLVFCLRVVSPSLP